MGLITEDLNSLWIDGKKMELIQKNDVLNPATGEKIGEFSHGGEKETKLAIDAAAHAFPTWAKQPPESRNQYLSKWKDKIQENKEELALLLSKEQGKPLKEAMGEISGSIVLLNWHMEESRRIQGEIIPASNTNQRLLILKEAIGVVGLITPMNFPASIVMRKLASALTAGCTVILKPAGQTPLIAIALFELLMETGLPNGVANLITGNSSEIGSTLMGDSRVRKVSFTGSTQVGKKLMDQASDNVKRLSLELGGNTPVIIFPDADLDKAVDGIISNKFENCGQVCNGINLIYVHEDIHEELVTKLVEKTKKIKVNIGLESDSDIGPLIDETALEKVDSLVKDAEKNGAKVLLGGKRLDEQKFENGNFYAPTILDNVNKEMEIANDEVFGPVAPILTFKTESNVIQKANDTPYGLAAYVYTNDFSRINHLIEVDGLEAGNVVINGTSIAYPQAPFGGVKESGIGREGGRQGQEEYYELKYVVINY
ncbi:NAD-dependent succinate-semialdehyde dehydrogenase [Oceanobacillus sp. CAU 1775]